MAKILVVDDNAQVRATTCNILETAGHDAREGDARTAVETMESMAPDLVLTDLVMPDKMGTDLIQDLRRAGYDGAIIAMSGGGGAMGPGDLLEKARALGADECVSKPFHRADLLAKVAAVLEQRRAS